MEDSEGRRPMRRAKPVDLDSELAKYEHLQYLAPSINQVDIVVETVERWEDQQPSLDVKIKNGRVRAVVRINMSVKKAIALVSGLVTVFATIVTYVASHGPAVLRLLTGLQGSGLTGP